MNLCDKNHDEVCYEGRQCPVCDLISDHKDEVRDLQKEIDSLKEELSEAESDLEGRKEALIEVLEAAQEVERRKEPHEHDR